MRPKYFFPAAGWLLVIAILSGYPGNKIPLDPFFGFDKLVHVAIYMLLAFLLFFGFNKQPHLHSNIKKALWSIILGVFFGGLMEILQESIFINRSGNWYDFIANTIGAIMGVLLYPLIVKLLPIKK